MLFPTSHTVINSRLKTSVFDDVLSVEIIQLIMVFQLIYGVICKALG